MHGPLISTDEIDDFIILRVQLFASRIRRTLMRDVLKDAGLSILEWRLLFSIARFGSCHVGFITQRTSVDPAHGSRAAAALERKGLIHRVEDPDNKRRKLVSLTDQGRRTFEHIWPRARNITAARTDLLSSRQLAELKHLLDLVNGVSDAPDPLGIGFEPRQSQEQHTLSDV